MATVIQFKRSATQNSVPATSDLSLGELAVKAVSRLLIEVCLEKYQLLLS